MFREIMPDGTTRLSGDHIPTRIGYTNAWSFIDKTDVACTFADGLPPRLGDLLVSQNGLASGEVYYITKIYPTGNVDVEYTGVTFAVVDPHRAAVALNSGGGTVSTLSTFVKVGNFALEDSEGDISYSSTTITINQAGWYQINASLRMDSATAGRRVSMIRVNNLEVVRMGDDNFASQMAHAGGLVKKLNVGDYIETFVWTTVSSVFAAGRMSAIKIRL